MLLTAPLRDGEAYVVVAARGGDDRRPAWFPDLRDHQDVEVAVQDGPREPMRARIADPDTRARWWPEIAERYRIYAGYQRRTDREILRVLLERRDAPA